MTLTESNRRILCLAAVACGALLAGCGGGGTGGDVMVMQPAATRPASQPATQPAETAPDPATQPAAAPEVFAAAPSYINIDDVPHEFPPARLFLKREGGRVKVRLFGEQPEGEAAADRWKGQSFYFEMELDVPADPANPPGDSVSADELAAAEWLYHADTSDRADTPSGIRLARGGTILQPGDVIVTFDPLDQDLVQVTLSGTFNEFDARRPREPVRLRQVRVVAILDAQTLRR